MKKLITLMVAGLMLVAFNVFAGDDSYTSVINPVGQIYQSIDYDDFTDGGGTTGALTLTPTLPAGAIPIAWRAVVSTGFTGATSATLLVGVSTDTDKFSASDGQNIFAAGTYADSALGEAVGCDSLGSAQSVYLQLTADTDFTLVTAGSMKLYLYYLRP